MVCKSLGLLHLYCQESSSVALLHPKITLDICTFISKEETSTSRFPKIPYAFSCITSSKGLLRDVDDSKLLRAFSLDLWDPFRELSFHSIEKEEKNDTWHRVERSSGMFSRKLRLPENVKMDEITASMENGVLTVTVTVPKAQVKKPDVKAIDISG